jgi:hypothetical protein
MDNINTDKLYNFISQASILFLLFLIVYLMYIDFIREKMSNKKIYQTSLHEKFNNLISINGENIKFDKNDSTGLTLQNMKRIIPNKIEEHFQPIDPDLKYIIKRNYNIISNAKCLSGDYNNVELNKCYMSVSDFYPTQSYLSTAIYIHPLSDSIPGESINKKTFYAKIKDEKGNILSYNDYIESNVTSGLPEVVNLGYKSNYFNFSTASGTNYINFSKGNHKFDYTQPLEKKIIQYFARYVKYGIYALKNKTNDIDVINGLLITDQTKFNNLSNDLQTKVNTQKQNIMDGLQNMLLLKSGTIGSFKLPADIHNIKELLIKYYEPFFNNSQYPNSNLTINDTSSLILLVDPKTQADDINNITIFSMIFKINIKIELIKLKPNLTDNKLDPKLLTSLSSLQNLSVDENTYVYSYENTISFPLALPFNLPNLTISDTSSKLTQPVGSTDIAKPSTFSSADVSDTKWYDDIKTYMSTLFIDNQLQQRNKIPIKSGINAVTTIMNSIDPIKNDINNLSNITNIFAYYIPDNNDFTSTTGNFYFIITLNQSNNIDPNIVYVLMFNNSYDPNFCEDPRADLFKKKCLPGCPDGYNIDLGLICVKSDITNFTPNSDFCVQLNALSPVATKNSILQGFIDACNSDNINNVANESLFNINDIKGIKQINNNNYVLNQAINDTSLLQSSGDFSTDTSADSVFSTSFNNVSNPTAPLTNKISVTESKDESLDESEVVNVQHFGNIPESISTRRDRIRYDIKSREETKPEINKQTGKKIIHFSPFLN